MIYTLSFRKVSLLDWNQVILTLNLDLDLDQDRRKQDLIDLVLVSSHRVKKQKQTAQGESTKSNISTLPQSRSGKGKGKGKASRPRFQPSPQAAQSLDTQTDRHLLDAENDDSVDTIDIEMVTTEWQQAGPDFTPQLHDFEDEGL